MTRFARSTILLLLAATSLPARELAAQERLPPVIDPGLGEQAIPYGEPGQAVEPEPPPSASYPPRRAGGGGFGSGGPGGGLGMGGPGGPMGGAPGYEATWYPAQDVSGQPTDLGLVRQSLSFGAPLWMGETDMVMASLSFRNSLFFTDAILPDSLRAFPDQLTSVNFGLNYMRQFDNGWSGGLMGGFGSASDKPFHSMDEMTANIGGFLRVPARNGRDSWQFMLMYMYGGPINFPIPMLAYAWNPSEQLRVNIGLPFSVAWQMSDDLLLNLSYMPLNNINARLTWSIAPSLQVYGGYEFLNESYFLIDRVETDDRFFAFEQRLITGLRWNFWRNANFELHAGYSFGRNYGEGSSQWSSLSDQVDVDPGPFVGMSLRWRF
ncbi:MAG: DUF6268 family outer membrane beta-barrel protein [Pirellulaceae bacterium]|nr:DUF6268 family outer membrane beta-barrel protein [Pirellulaceae bacterium]